MGVIGGLIMVFVCVVGSFAFHGGDVGILWQPVEVVIIFGSAVCGVFVACNGQQIKALVHAMSMTIKAKPFTKDDYTQLLMLLYELVKTAKGNILALESHVEKPENSDIFKRYPAVLENHHACGFIADTLKVQISSPVSPFDLEELMEADIKSTHAEEHFSFHTISRVSDSFPGLGIVAAVLGVVYTMGKLTEGKEVIGQSVAAALVGTFLGVLLAYGIFQPIAAKIENNIGEEHTYFMVTKAALLAFAKDCSPKVCVEFARRTIPPANRPSFEELDKATSNAGKAA